MNSQNNLRGRTPLPQNAEIKINDISITITDKTETVSAGSSCLVYHGFTKDLPPRSLIERQFNYRPVIIKEFYPYLGETIITRDPDSQMLIIPEEIRKSTSYQKVYQQFMQSISVQKKLQESSAKNITVPSIIVGTYGDSYYNISDSRRGHPLSFDRIDTLTDKLLHFITLLYAFEELHKAGYIMLDIKPENFLWSYEDTSVLIIDTDSFIHYEDETISKDQLLFTNMKYAAPEIKYMELFMENGDFDMARRLLTPSTNIYSLGLYLYDLIFEKPYTGKNADDLELFVDLYYKNPYNNQNAERTEISTIGKKLLHIFDKVLVNDLLLRRITCYKTVSAFIVDVDEILKAGIVNFL